MEHGIKGLYWVIKARKDKEGKYWRCKRGWKVGEVEKWVLIQERREGWSLAWRFYQLLVRHLIAIILVSDGVIVIRWFHILPDPCMSLYCNHAIRHLFNWDTRNQQYSDVNGFLAKESGKTLAIHGNLSPFIHQSKLWWSMSVKNRRR